MLTDRYRQLPALHGPSAGRTPAFGPELLSHAGDALLLDTNTCLPGWPLSHGQAHCVPGAGATADWGCSGQLDGGDAR
jgi:hypothetical protein